MASPRLETFCCPNRDAATEFVVTFQPVLFGALTLGSAAVSLILAVLQILPKRKGYRRLGQYPLPRPASSSRILFIISICDTLGCAGKLGLLVFPCCSEFCFSQRACLAPITHAHIWFLTLLLLLCVQIETFWLEKKWLMTFFLYKSTIVEPFKIRVLVIIVITMSL